MARKQQLITELFAINSELYLTIKKGTKELQQQYAKRQNLEELIMEGQQHVTTVSAHLRRKTSSHQDRLG